jgi:hypothetical protein
MTTVLSSKREIARGPGAIHLVNPLGCSNWDEQISRLPGASFFHTQAWARALYETYEYSPVYFVAKNENSITSVLPLMEVDSWLTGRRGISLPFTDTCEPLCSNRTEFEQLAARTMSHARARHWKYCEFRDARAWFANAIASTSYYGHTLNLNRDEPGLFAQADSATRRAVRKAEKSELEIEFAHSLEAVRHFYNLMCRTRRRLGLPPQSFRFFANIHRHVLAKGRGCVVLARHAGAAVAGAIYFHAGNMALYKFGASDDRFQHLRGNNLVMWRAIEWHARMGFETLHFGRTSLQNEGLRAYKLSWGTNESRIDYFKYDFRQNAFVTETDRASSGVHTKLFRLLPSHLSRLIGTFLYKHVA